MLGADSTRFHGEIQLLRHPFGYVKLCSYGVNFESKTWFVDNLNTDNSFHIHDYLKLAQKCL